MERPKDVDEYIARAPKEAQAKLREIRATIRAAAPDAEELISYGMPYYRYEGRLAYFGLAKNHIGLYALVDPMQEFREELEGYVASKGTIRFPLDERLPRALITKLVKAQVRKNDEAKRKKR